MKEFEAKGIRIVAISNDEKPPLAEMQRELGLPFTLLSDTENSVIKRYGLVHAGGRGDGADISRPAEILINAQGMIHWVMFTDNFRVRARPETILEAAANL